VTCKRCACEFHSVLSVKSARCILYPLQPQFCARYAKPRRNSASRKTRGAGRRGGCKVAGLLAPGVGFPASSRAGAVRIRIVAVIVLVLWPKKRPRGIGILLGRSVRRCGRVARRDRIERARPKDSSDAFRRGFLACAACRNRSAAFRMLPVGCAPLADPPIASSAIAPLAIGFMVGHYAAQPLFSLSTARARAHTCIIAVIAPEGTRGTRRNARHRHARRAADYGRLLWQTS
jgi:hypothetical protein